MKLNTKTKSGFVGCASSAAALSLVAMAMLCPGVDGVFAESCPNGAETCSTQPGDITVGFNVQAVSEGDNGDLLLKTGNLNVSFTVNPYIEISQNPTDVAVTADNPTASGVTKTGKTDFAVRTNSSTGFDVYVTADNKLLSPADSSNTAAINPISASNTALTAFGANTWGYAVTNRGTDPTTYRSINDATKAYGLGTFSSTATNLQLNFGTKVTDTLPADTYSTTIKVSAVLSGAEVASLAGSEPVAQEEYVAEDDSTEAYSYDDYSYDAYDYGYVDEYYYYDDYEY